MRIITRIPLYAAFAVVSCWSNFSFAGPGDDNTVVKADDPAKKAEAVQSLATEGPKIGELIDLVKSQATPTNALVPVNTLPFNLRREGDVNQLERFQNAITLDPEVEQKLRVALGNDGYETLKSLAKDVSNASKKSDPWRQVAAAIDAYHPDSMERHQAKRIIVLWLQEEVKRYPGGQVASPLIIQTMTPVVVVPDINQVLERIETALKGAKSIESKEVLQPVGYLLGLAPYLPKLDQKVQLQMLTKAIQLADANSDRGELGVLEQYLLEITQVVVRDNRVFTTLGSVHAFDMGLRYFQAITAASYVPQGKEGSVLATAETLIKGLEERLAAAQKHSWLETDFYWRVKFSLRRFLLEMVKDHPSLLSRIDEFPQTRDYILKQTVRDGCAAHVANPVQLLLTDAGHQ